METLLNFPSSPPTLASICLEKIWLEDLPVSDLPITLQKDLAKLEGGLFVKKKRELTRSDDLMGNDYLIGNDILIGNYSEVKLLKEPGGFHLEVGGGRNRHLETGDFHRVHSDPPILIEESKGWVETGKSLQYRYVGRISDDEGFQWRWACRIIFGENGMSLTEEGELKESNGSVYFHKDEVDYDKI